jgi:hypothetical protein
MDSSFTWPLAIAFIGGIGAFFTFLYGMLKKPNDLWRHPMEELEKKVVELETRLHNVQDKTESIEKDQDQLDNRVLKRMDDLDQKIDRFVEILINYFSTDQKKD